MSEFRGPDSHIHNIARGLLVQSDDIILCRAKDAEWFFLPGGHIEDGESAYTALGRELQEEIEEIDYSISSFVGACENIFPLEENVFQHELNIVFKVDVPEGSDVVSVEDHIEFVKVTSEEFQNVKILPNTLHEGVIAWQNTGVPFFKEL